MKKFWNKKSFWQSLLSVIVLAIFVLLTTGTINELNDFMKYDIKYLGNGLWEETEYYDGDKSVITGGVDKTKRMEGPVTIHKTEKDGNSWSTEKVNMIGGLRHGESTCSYTYFSGSRYVTHVVKQYYNMGYCVDKAPQKAASGSKADNSAFTILGNKYPWFLLSLNVFGFDTAYVESYLGAVETKLNTYLYDISKFSDYYGDAVDELGDTPYDSIITLNSQLTMFQGLAEMKNSEFRLAIIDHYRLAGSTTFNIISTTYPGYLLTLNGKGVNNEDFKVFCQDMDSRMTSYGVLNQQDPFFIDSVDARMFRAILAIMNAGKSFSLSAESSVNNTLLNFKDHDINDIYDEVISLLKPSFSKSTPKEVGNVVVMHMLEEYYVPEEIIRQAVMEAYFIKGGVKRVPTATTVFESNNSSTSATLQGYVIEDGGAAVTSRGIAWATFYAPTKNDNPINSGTGTGNFNVTLNGLTPGTTYYARTFATNSAGTAYGNTVSFVASITTDVNDIKILNRDFIIYPNPASSLTTFSIQVESPGSIILNIIDMKGKVVLNKDLGSMPQGENQVLLNLSVLQNGMYICQLMQGSTNIARKLIISH
jgi:hypothetical protein